MLTISKPMPDRLDIELSGTLGTEAMRAGLEDLIEKSAGISGGKMLYRIVDFEMPTMGALAVELQQMPKLIGLVGKFDKCAVLSDIGWIRTAAEIEGAIIPTLTIRSFPLSSAKAAEDWLTGTGPTEKQEEPENFPI